MEKYYSFAGIEVAAIAPDGCMYEADGVLAPFRVSRVSAPHRFEFVFAENLAEPLGVQVAAGPDYAVFSHNGSEIRYIGTAKGDWKTAHMRVCHTGMRHAAELKASVYSMGVTPKTLLRAAAAEHLITVNGGLLLHSACVAANGGAILFTAPSGVGKSTQAELWRSLRGARIINGDRCAVAIAQGEVLACGIPFAGSSVYCENVTLPLKAIVYLAQAPRTTIRTLRGTEAFRRIWEGVCVNTWNAGDVAAAMDTAARVTGAVPVYYLACTPDESAVLALEQQLGKQVEA